MLPSLKLPRPIQVAYLVLTFKLSKYRDVCEISSVILIRSFDPRNRIGDH